MLNSKFALVMVAFVFAMAFMSTSATAEVDETGIAINFSRFNGQTGWGVNAETPYAVGRFDGSAGVTGQKSETAFRGRYNANLGTSIHMFRVQSFINGSMRGPGLEDMAIQSDTGVSGVSPGFELLGFKASVEIGIFGRNSSPFLGDNAYNDLIAIGYLDTDLEKVEGLNKIEPPPDGIPFKDTDSLNAIGSLNLVHESGFGIKFSLKPEIAGEEGSDPAHQGVVSFRSGYELGENVALDVRIDYFLQRYQGKTTKEAAAFIGIRLSFN